MSIAATSFPPSPSRVALEARSIRKSFAGVRALRNASLNLRAGEVHALVGENGAGKSTLTRVITGALVPDEGSLEIFGSIITHNSATIARNLGVAAISQNPSLFPQLSVAENIALPTEGGSSRWTVNWRARRDRARDLLASLGAEIDPSRLVSTLSMAEQGIVEIAKTIGARAKILIMDEPTALLTQREVGNLFRLIARLRSDGVGIIYISHRLEEILTIADRITVLRDGETVACKDARHVDRQELISLMVGRSVEAIFPKREVPKGEVALELRDLSNPAAGLHNISLAVRTGEIFGLAGLVGSGRTELARTLFGLTPSASEVLLFGQAFRIRSPADAIRLGIGYLPEDRRQHGVILDMTVACNTSMADLQQVSRSGLIDTRKENSLASGYVGGLRVKTSSIFAKVGALSGGNQQKIALARWLATRPRIMILDEPTQGVDIGSKAEIHELIVGLAEQGMAVILISSELPEILGMSDRIGVVRAGTIAAILSRDEATQENIMSIAFGDNAAAGLATA